MEVADDFEDQLSEINFVPCVKFVKRGIANPTNIADVRNYSNFSFTYARFGVFQKKFRVSSQM
jgi:hypothetical protein